MKDDRLLKSEFVEKPCQQSDSGQAASYKGSNVPGCTSGHHPTAPLRPDLGHEALGTRHVPAIAAAAAPFC